MAIPNERHEGFHCPPVPTKYYSKNRSVGRSHTYKFPSPGDPTLVESPKYFGTVSSNRSNEDMLKQIYEKVLNIDQEHKTMITMQEKKKKRPTGTGGSSLVLATSNFTPRNSVYVETKFETQKTIHKSSGSIVSIRKDSLATPEDGTSMGDVYTNNADTIPKYGFRQSSENVHASRLSFGKRSPMSISRSKTKVKRITYSGTSIDYS